MRSKAKNQSEVATRKAMSKSQTKRKESWAYAPHSKKWSSVGRMHCWAKFAGRSKSLDECSNTWLSRSSWTSRPKASTTSLKVMSASVPKKSWSLPTAVLSWAMSWWWLTTVAEHQLRVSSDSDASLIGMRFSGLCLMGLKTSQRWYLETSETTTYSKLSKPTEWLTDKYKNCLRVSSLLKQTFYWR